MHATLWPNAPPLAQCSLAPRSPARRRLQGTALKLARPVLHAARERTYFFGGLPGALGVAFFLESGGWS
jgi:hypothetical protein